MNCCYMNGQSYKTNPYKEKSYVLNSKLLAIITTRLVSWNKEKKGQPGALKLPHSQGPGRGPTIWCIVRSLTLFLHKRLFPGLEPVTLRSHDNNFTGCTKVTPLLEQGNI